MNDHTNQRNAACDKNGGWVAWAMQGWILSQGNKALYVLFHIQTCTSNSTAMIATSPHATISLEVINWYQFRERIRLAELLL